ncbi:Nicotine blue oxidoreductase [Pedobacter sp. Bi27]|uniref:nucleotidyltransferase family protein n=1 Tax=unclassified Pedobacter TaxID=2628915 RepID=UPI001D9B91C0|nr:MULTISPECIES: nucleotidyltransferase family protein [unclassified Pedobacter]CAH0272934.1 Nicotine blue oxidoreductase [Pedobacter sp. Bi36]CAH0298511.1 Nicotine blue oxidoreductase [Pedobacter sp. Bi126]CAH0309388.1 Nicotine blue oxidoreductase [Pedobacter sp. Bi27]
MKTGIIILAAGSSSRLGRPKQLLDYKGKTLLQTIINEALETSCRPVITVLGANAKEIASQHQHDQVNFVINESWENGMASSIVAGLSAIIRNNSEIESIIIAVADQAFIKMSNFNNLIEKQKETGKNIIASTYSETIGTPVLFKKDYFEALLSLTGAEGAKKILKQYPQDVETVVFEHGEIDIDTETDYNNLISQQ